MKTRTRGWQGAGWMCGLVSALLVAGCAKKAENTTTAESATPAPAASAVAGQPINIHWDPTSNCAQFTPPVDTLITGSSVNFNSSVDQPDTVSAPAGCFSANDTSFVVTKGQSPTMRAYSAGSYRLRFSLPTCQSPTGGTGPTILIADGK